MGFSLPTYTQKICSRREEGENCDPWHWLGGTGGDGQIESSLTAAHQSTTLFSLLTLSVMNICQVLRKLDVDNGLPMDVTIVSPRPFFFYTPLLAGAAVGTVETKSIIEPIRSFCARTGSTDAKYVQASAYDVDFTAKEIMARVGSRTQYPAGITAPGVPQNQASLSLPYDKLIIAIGTEPATFGIPGVAEHALFMKEIDDGAICQQRLLGCLERADALIHSGAPDSEVDKILHFVIVGGGPTGVELAGELSDFISNDVNRLFPRLKGRIKLTLVEAMGRVLAPFKTEVAVVATESLVERGVAVRCDTMVKKVEPTNVSVQVKGAPEKEQLDFGILVWAAGIKARPLVAKLRESIGSEAGQNDRRGGL